MAYEAYSKTELLEELYGRDAQIAALEEENEELREEIKELEGVVAARDEELTDVENAAYQYHDAIRGALADLRALSEVPFGLLSSAIDSIVTSLREAL